ncbi:hypothetical protein EVG20_g5083 [Dentipellis fragilis]|uniref:H-type lectin domain-containing protein n=1 Tax=Dentipellis fragilis TaxID=205917 RepID=A0A4Y9YW96_9AGAM|nr:hypothetical protein EVG20_g5083 [Dentipellis fragilis]
MLTSIHFFSPKSADKSEVASCLILLAALTRAHRIASYRVRIRVCLLGVAARPSHPVHEFHETHTARLECRADDRREVCFHATPCEPPQSLPDAGFAYACLDHGYTQIPLLYIDDGPIVYLFTGMNFRSDITAATLYPGSCLPTRNHHGDEPNEDAISRPVFNGPIMRFSFSDKDINTYEELLWALLNQKKGSGKPAPDRSAEIPSPIPVPTYRSLSLPNLKGAVPDANHIQKYLEDELEVPPDHITNLRDKDATKADIIRELRALATDERIRPGDPIFIFYAGHGSTAKAPDGWEAGGPKIQLICPHDHLEIVDGRQVIGIPDRTLGSLLSNIAKEKGDNISVILDCCYSGSGTRDDEFDPDRLVRGIETTVKIPSDLDKDIWSNSSGDRLAKIASGFSHSGLRSHVLLAACSAEETAKEDNRRGVFTKALLEALRMYGADKVTYKDLTQRIPLLPAQSPQCEGVNAERILFNARAPARGRVLHKIRMKGDKYDMDAGAAHGITEGAEFTVYKDRDDLDTPLGTLIVLQMAAFSSVLDVLPYGDRFKLNKDAYALQTRAGAQEDLRIHVALDDRLTDLFEALATEMQKTGSGAQKILLDTKEKSVLDLQLEKDRIVFNILDPLVTGYGLKRIPHTIDVDVDAAMPLHKIKVEVYELEEADGEYDEDLQAILRPKGPNLKRGDVVDVVADGTRYGVKVVNTTNVPLYASVFFFSHGDLSIQSYFETPRAVGKVDAPLKAQQSLTIGYGAGGAAPYEYYLEDGQDIDVGFLKLFISTEPVDLSHVPQPSPFTDGRGGKPSTVKTEPVWDTILVPIIQHRDPLVPVSPTNPEPAPLPEPTPAPEPEVPETEKQTITVGIANTREIHPWNKPRPVTTKTITFDKLVPIPQILPRGLTDFDIGCSRDIRVVTHKQDIAHGFDLSFITWGGTSLHSAGASWLQLPQEEKDFQWGKFSTLEVTSRAQPKPASSRWIAFERDFAEPPRVVVFLSALDMANSKDWHVTVTATDITRSGFKIQVETWADSLLYSANAGWIAYPQGRDGIHSGRADTRDVRPWVYPQLKNSGKVMFGDVTFAHPPKVFFALNSVNINRGTNPRIKASVGDVTASGMTWHIDAWSNTALYSAGISYICVA